MFGGPGDVFFFDKRLNGHLWWLDSMLRENYFGHGLPTVFSGMFFLVFTRNSSFSHFTKLQGKCEEKRCP